MIQINELRVGNHIWNGVITEVRKDGFKFHDGYSEWDSTKLAESSIEPYTLTTEEFEKCGFEIYDIIGSRVIYQHSKFKGIKAEQVPGAIAIYVGESLLCYCEYVHQLQNLYFALTGKELTFKP